ncbi:MAG: hypothetical protein HZA50_15770 [Planctomycetes bacterium]|nr:hypothetical protein [Planctomycetota bacterium]
MKKNNPPLIEITYRGIRALVKELGPAGMVRFMQQWYPGFGDYSKERHKWLDRHSVAHVADNLRKIRRLRKTGDKQT